MRLPLNGLLALLICAGCAMADSPPLVNPVGADAEPPAATARAKTPAKAPAKKPAPPAGGDGKLSPDSSVDRVLDALDRRGRGLKEFVADVALKEEDDLGLSSTRKGKVWHQRQGEDDSRIRVVFDTREDEENVYDEKLEYMLDDGWLLDRDFKKKIEVRRQVLKPGEKLNLLKLGEGPFPLPIGQDKKEVKRLFDVTKIAPADGDPPASVHLQLKPKKGTEFAKKFDLMDVWVDEKSEFPVRIDMTTQASFKSTALTNLKVNPDPALTDADFTPEQI